MNNMNNNIGMYNMNNNMGINFNNGILMNQVNQMNSKTHNPFLYNQYGLDLNSLNTQSSSPSNTIINPDLNNIIENSNDTNNNSKNDNMTIICVLISEDNKEDELTKVHIK